MRLIDADALFNCDPYYYDNECDKYAWDMISLAPTIDAVPVIRCKDCRHYSLWDDGHHKEWMCGIYQMVCDDTDYCSLASRKEGCQ